MPKITNANLTSNSPVIKGDEGVWDAKLNYITELTEDKLNEVITDLNYITGINSVWNVIDYSTFADFPIIGEPITIYFAIAENKRYMWGGSVYIDLNLGSGTVSSVNNRTGDIILTKSDVGLSNVDNTSDITKATTTNYSALATTSKTLTGSINEVKSATDSKAPLASPTFTGTVTLPSSTSIGTVSATEIGYLDNVTSNIQTQLNSKAPTASPTLTGTVVLPTTTSIGNVDSTEISYLDGVTSGIQAQLNGKQNTLISGSNIKTINGESLLGNGDIALEGGLVKQFDTIADAQNYSGFVEGDRIQVLGYYSKNDGAGHERVYSLTDDGSGVTCGIGFLNYAPKNSTYYPEHFGAVGDCDTTNYTGTDNTLAIQKMFDCNPKKVIFSKHYLVSGVDIGDNIEIIFINDSSINLKNNSNRPVIQNKNFKLNVDKNITIENLTLNGNDLNQVHHLTTGEYAGEYLSGLRLFGVENLKLKNIRINRARTFGIWLSEIKDLVAHDITFKQRMDGAPDNQDGLHINGKSYNLDIRNIKGSTNDDMVALNADDGALGSNVRFGEIINATIDNVVGENCLNGIRMLSATSLVDKIFIRNVGGTYRDPAINLSSYGLGTGKFGAITIDGVDCSCSNAFAGDEYYGVIVLNNVIHSLSISNIKKRHPLDNRPMIKTLGNCNLATLTIDNFDIYIPNASPSPPVNDTYIELRGLVGSVIVNNLNMFRDDLLSNDGCLIHVNGGKLGSLQLNNIHIKNMEDSIVVNNTGEVKFIQANNIHDVGSAPNTSFIVLDSSIETVVQIDNIISDRSIVNEIGTGTLSRKSKINVNSDVIVYNNALQNLNSTYQILNADMEVLDNFSSYNTSTKKFLAKEQGTYEIKLNSSITIPTTNTTIVVAVYAGGVLAEYLLGQAYNADCIINCSTFMYLPKNTEIDIRIYSSNASSIPSQKAFLKIHKIN